jgi:hypothetical protein
MEVSNTKNGLLDSGVHTFFKTTQSNPWSINLSPRDMKLIKTSTRNAFSFTTYSFALQIAVAKDSSIVPASYFVFGISKYILWIVSVTLS